MFMRDDDGGEFFMVNLVGFTEGPARHPDTGAKVDARELVTISDPLQSKFLPVVDTQHFLPYTVGLS